MANMNQMLKTSSTNANENGNLTKRTGVKRS
jgi:hypothetical protein